MFSFGVAHPDDPFFRLLSRFLKVNKLQFGKAKKRSTLWPENEFFNMDALTVLSIWDTALVYWTLTAYFTTHLHTLHLGHSPERPEGPQSSHGFEDGNITGSQETGSKIDQGDGDDDKVEPTPGVAEVHNTAHGKKFEVGLQETDHGEDTT